MIFRKIFNDGRSEIALRQDAVGHVSIETRDLKRDVVDIVSISPEGMDAVAAAWPSFKGEMAK